MTTSLRTIETTRGRIGYRMAGTGPDTLLLLHGLGGNSLSWDAQLTGLADGRSVVAWDAPGYGASDDLPTEAPSPDDYVGALGAFMDALRIETCDLVGHSMGGIVAARFAASHPARIRSLILSCTSADFSPSGPGFAARVEDLHTMPAAEFGRRRAEGMAAPATPQPVRDRLAAVAATARLPGFAAAARMLGRSDNRHLLPHLSLPVMVIAGAEDRIAPVAEADRLAALIPGARRVTIAGAGHAPYAEAVASYNDAVSDFLPRR